MFTRILITFLKHLSVPHELPYAGPLWLYVGFLNTSQGQVRRCLFRDTRAPAQLAVSNLGHLITKDSSVWVRVLQQKYPLIGPF